MLSENDQVLIQKANNTPYIYWLEILELINKAESEEAKKEINKIAIRKNQIEEYKSYCN